jgi:hypothetical protein
MFSKGKDLGSMLSRWRQMKAVFWHLVSIYTVLAALKAESTSTPCLIRSLPRLPHHLVVPLAMVVVVFILEEESFHYTVSSERDCCDSKSGKGALEAVPPCERSRIPPSFTTRA